MTLGIVIAFMISQEFHWAADLVTPDDGSVIPR